MRTIFNAWTRAGATAETIEQTRAGAIAETIEQTRAGAVAETIERIPLLSGNGPRCRLLFL
jgi:hypothetical protein